MIQIEALPQAAGVDVHAVMSDLCRRVAVCMDADSGQVWATWRTVEAYAEGGAPAASQPGSTHPPVARLIAFEGRSVEQIRSALEAAADALAEGLGLEHGNAFVLFDEARAGRVYTGGTVRG
ncbi:MAG: tautomerase family protein [Planctomycetota bacterium]